MTTAPTTTHFLDRTDPTFVNDLKRSVVHVEEVVKRINDRIQDDHQITNVTLHVMETKIRPHASERKKYSDGGDVKVTWIHDGVEKSAMLEFKQRAGYKFETLAGFRYDDVYVDSLSKFERIRKRNNTLGYVLTDKFMTCIFSTCMNVFAKHMVVEEKYFRSRPCKWSSLPKEHFHEGLDNVCKMIVHLAAQFEKHDPGDLQTSQLRRQAKLTARKIKDLTFQLDALRKSQTKIVAQLAEATSSSSPTYPELHGPPMKKSTK
jgi:hypothetical protein